MDKNIKILMADDSAFMRSVLKSILTTNGFTNFLEASNGIEAIELFNKEHPDLVLLDIIMPEKGGLEVLKEIGSKGKFIVISAVGQDKIIEEAKTLGARGYVIKPFDNHQVVEVVEKVLQ